MRRRSCDCILPAGQIEANIQLIRAAGRGYLKEAKKAIDAGADINCQDCNCQTPLHLASLRDNLDIVDFLLYLGASTSIEDLAGDTALRIANRKGHRAVAASIQKASQDGKNHHRSASKPTKPSSSAELAMATNFPPAVASEMMRTGHVELICKESVSILFLELPDYSAMRGSMDPVALCRLLDRLFSDLDALAHAHGVERIDAFDGCYLAATNYSNPQPADHAVRLTHFALVALAAAAALPADPRDPGPAALRLRAGMHCGAVCGRVVGAHGGRKHTLHGDAVNAASRMQSTSAPGAVQCSAAAAALVAAQSGGPAAAGLLLAGRGEPLLVKGLGWMSTFWVRETPALRQTPEFIATPEPRSSPESPAGQARRAKPTARILACDHSCAADSDAPVDAGPGRARAGDAAVVVPPKSPPGPPESQAELGPGGPAGQWAGLGLSGVEL